MSSVVILTVAALIGTNWGCTRPTRRTGSSRRGAAAADDTYTVAGSWKHADLAPARAIAERARIRLDNHDGNVISKPDAGTGETAAPAGILSLRDHR